MNSLLVVSVVTLFFTSFPLPYTHRPVLGSARELSEDRQSAPIVSFTPAALLANASASLSVSSTSMILWSPPSPS